MPAMAEYLMPAAVVAAPGESWGDLPMAAPPRIFLTFSSGALPTTPEQTPLPSTPSSPGAWPEGVLPPPGLEVPEAPLPKAQNLRFGIGSFGHPHFCSRPCVHIAKGHVCPREMACAYCHFPHRPIPKPDWQLRQSLLAASDQKLLVTFLPIIIKKAAKEGLIPRVDGLIELLKAEVRGAQCEPIPMGTLRPMRMSFMHLVESSMRRLPPHIRAEVNRLKLELPPPVLTHGGAGPSLVL
ncbi:unnamed protein product [Symbiodinium sp. CCMP2592]|nr:unnamed protein product [Symbiodinium sp. CCMP2592]